jgi:uncharacterized damage-inducible protein DinB
MSISAVVRSHLDYTAWASRRLVASAAALPPDELNRDFQTADRSILETLVHIFAGDRVWLARLAGAPIPAFLTDADRSLSVLEREWPPLQERWKEWAARLTDETALTELAYLDLKGRRWTQPAWELALHVVNHGTHHRGQVAGFLRSMGHTPPPIDFVVFCRERGRA